ncbi:MAG: DUF6687 family protein [Acidimicrobiales bacterium]
MSRALPYVPVEELKGRPHVLVDGAARPGSVLTLSHWPQSPTPPALARDLSAQIVFAFLHATRGEVAPGDGAPGRGGRGRSGGVGIRSAIAAVSRAEAVTNDHFDEDGVVSVFSMAEPDVALRHEGLLVEVVSCGDFGVVRSRQAARIAFAVGPIGEQAVEASEPGSVGERPGSWSGPRYRAVLERAVELIEHTEHFRRYWEQEDAVLAASLDDLRAGLVRIDEVPEVDLAVVTRLAGAVPTPGSAAATGRLGAVALHEVALHSATPASRILAFHEGRCELYLRYEGWVRYVSRQVPRRPDLAPLAEQLSAAEPSGVRWAADGVGSLVTRMRPEPDGETDLDPAMICGVVVAYLKSAPPAWDPFRRDGALVPTGERRPPR